MPVSLLKPIDGEIYGESTELRKHRKRYMGKHYDLPIAFIVVDVALVFRMFPPW